MEVIFMGMTMSQKILAAHAGLDSVKAGQLIEAQLDMVLGNDIHRLLPSTYSMTAKQAVYLTTQKSLW